MIIILKLQILSVSVGYFIWDVQICLKYYSIYGAAFALHGIMALVALIISFRPYMMNLVRLLHARRNQYNLPPYQFGSSSNSATRILSFAFKISHGLLLASYFCVRIVLAPYFVYETIRQTIIQVMRLLCGPRPFIVVMWLFWLYWVNSGSGRLSTAPSFPTIRRPRRTKWIKLVLSI